VSARGDRIADNRAMSAEPTGYRPAFLSALRVTLPALSAAQRADAAPMIGSSQIVVPYTNFSLVMSKTRRLAYFTAVNIDGRQLKPITRESDSWRLDKRLERKHQIGATFYKGNPYDQGHLVRRLDPVWGTAADAAHRDTFHYTNAAPQHHTLNRDEWSDLEDYVLNNTATQRMRVSVFTGPVFRADDPLEKGIAVPVEFWKVVAMIKSDGTPSATAYLLSQRNLIGTRDFAFGGFRTYQIQIGEVERLSGLTFASLRPHDPLARLRDLYPARELQRLSDIVL
jgi:endonuclease G, mitochondrial